MGKGAGFSLSGLRFCGSQFMQEAAVNSVEDAKMTGNDREYTGIGSGRRKF